MELNKYKALFFDYDGTIVDTMPTLYSIYSTFLGMHGKMGTVAEFQDLNGPPITQVVEKLQSNHDLKGSSKELVDDYEMLLDISHTNEPDLVEGFKDFFAVVKGKRLGVVTAAHGDRVERTLKQHGLFESFEALIHGDRKLPGKPAPDIYIKALETFELAPEEVLVFEDGLNGMRSARNAGIDVVWMTDVGVAPDENVQIFSSWKEVYGAV